jgi:hypothetical protein
VAQVVELLVNKLEGLSSIPVLPQI